MRKAALFFLFLATSGWATVIPGHVPVSPAGPETLVIGPADLGPTGGSTAYEVMVKGHMYRIRQNGDIKSFRVFFGATTNVGWIKLRVWRPAGGGTYTLVGESEAFSSITADSINSFKLTTPITAQIGDYTGVRMVYSSSSGNNLNKTTAYQANTVSAETVSMYYVVNSTPVTGHNWEAESSLTNEVVRIQINMDAPDVVFFGDSITSGYSKTLSFSDDAAPIFSSTSGWPVQVAATEGVSFQTIARTGRTLGMLKDEFQTYVAPTYPKYIVLMGGVNDVNTNASTATVLSRMTDVLDEIIAIGAIPIVVGILPEAPHASNPPYYRAIDSLNPQFETLVEGSPYNGIYVDPTPGMGQFYATGDAGNLWQLKTGYAIGTDNVHLSDTGNDALAVIVSDALTLTPRGSTANTVNGSGGTETTDGLYTIHTFTTSGSFTVTENLAVEYLVVGGGGGGAAYFAGGGGAGESLYGQTTLTPGVYTVTVGAGGTAGIPAGPTSGGAGGNSVFGSITALGGGYGAYAAVGGNGGSGGGGGSTGAIGSAGGSATNPANGYDGGAALTSDKGYPGGGGGGATSIGVTATNLQGGNGGAGRMNGISGVSRFYSGGGGGGTRTGTNGIGGSGVGGDGGMGGAGSNNGAAGVAGSGSGGGGGGGIDADASGGAGGSGSVVVRYLTGTGPSSGGGSNGRAGFAPGSPWPFRWKGWKP